jgi:chromosome segregation ATPase
MTAFEAHYEQLVTDFEGHRRELLSFITSVVPNLTDMHRRKWRIKQFDNAIFDIKKVIAACNLQLDEEHAVLEQLNTQYDRLEGQSRKLTEDVKMLEGVTGIPAVMPCDTDTDVKKEIMALSEHFRTAFAEFYFQLPIVKQEIPADPTLDRDSRILVSTLRDYVVLRFDHRAADGHMSKEVEGMTVEADALKKRIKDDEERLEKELTIQRQRIEESATRMKGVIQEQARQLRTQGRKVATELQVTQDDLKAKVSELEGKARRLKSRASGLASQNKAMKESFRRRSTEIEADLDRFERRVDAIKQEPSAVDRKLVNIALILSEKSSLIDQAVAEMRQEIADFNTWLRR